VKKKHLWRSPRIDEIEEKLLKSGTSVLFLFLIALLIPNVSFAADQLEQKTGSQPPDGQIEVIKARLSGGGRLLDIRFRVHGAIGNRNISMRYARNVYAIEESTGERFYARRFARIGALGQKHLDEGPISLVTIDNPEGKIKKDSRITVVIGGLRQEHIIVEE
jgi:hypothetical protein